MHIAFNANSSYILGIKVTPTEVRATFTYFIMGYRLLLVYRLVL